MAMIELVIKIDEDIYHDIKDGFYDKNLRKMAIAIGNGISLSKGHGDLIDRNILLEDSYCFDDWAGNEINIVDVVTVKKTPTVIKADKETSCNLKESAEDI